MTIPPQNIGYLNPIPPMPYGPFDPVYYYLYSPGTQLTKDLYGATPASGYSPAGDSGLDFLLKNRQEVMRTKLELLTAELTERRRLLDYSLYRINRDQCEFKNMAFLRGEDIWDRYRFKLEQSILDLEGEKRKEESAYFRDVFFLKKELRELLVEGVEERQKAAMLKY